MKEDWEVTKRDLMDLLGTGPLHNIHLAASSAGGDTAGPHQATPARYSQSSLRCTPLGPCRSEALIRRVVQSTPSLVQKPFHADLIARESEGTGASAEKRAEAYAKVALLDALFYMPLMNARFYKSCRGARGIMRPSGSLHASPRWPPLLRSPHLYAAPSCLLIIPPAPLFVSID